MALFEEENELRQCTKAQHRDRYFHVVATLMEPNTKNTLTS